MQMFNGFVRPILEYGSQVWSPSLKKEIKSLESTLKKFTKRLFQGKSLDYNDRLVQVGQVSLQTRRKYLDLTTLFAYIREYPDVDDRQNIHFANRLNDLDKAKIIVKFRTTNLLQNEYTSRVILEWNALPLELKVLATFPNFKKKLLEYLKQ